MNLETCDIKSERRTSELVKVLNENNIPVEFYRIHCPSCDGKLYNRTDCEHYILENEE